MTSRKRQFNGGGSSSSPSESVTEDELRQYKELLAEAQIELDHEALIVISNLLRLNVSPDEICNVLKQIMPLCGILKRFKLKTKPSVEQ